MRWLCALWGRHEGARGGASCLGVGRPGSGALPAPTARPLGGLPGPTTHWLWVWGAAGVGTRHQPHSACSCALWGRHEGARGGRLLPGCGACGVGRSPTPNCPPSGRAAGARYPLAVGAGGCGRGDPSPTPCRALLRAVGAARGCPGGAPLAWVWGVRGRALSHPRLPALWAGCRGPLPTGCGCGGVRAWGPVTNPTARWLCALWGRHEGAQGGRLLLWCGASGVGRSPTPDCPPSGRAAGAHYPLAVGVGGCGCGDPSPTPQCAAFARCGGGMRVPGGVPLAWVWGVRGRALSHPRLPALWAGCRGPLPTGCGCGGLRAWEPVTNPTARWLCALWGRHEGARGGRLLPGCGASGVRRSPTPDCPPSGRAAGAHYPLAVGVGGCECGAAWVCVCVPCLAGSGGPASRARFGAPHLSFGRSCFALCLFGPLQAGVALFVVVLGFFFFLFPFSPWLRPHCVLLCVFSGPGCLGPWRLVLPPPLPPPPFFFYPFPPPICAPRCLLLCVFSGLGCPGPCFLSPPPPLFFFRPLSPPCCRRRSLLSACLARARVWSCPRWASSLWCPVPLCCVLWRCAAVWCCAVVPCLLSLFFSLLVALVSCFSLFVLGSGPVPGRFCFCVLPVRCCAGVPAPLLSVRCFLALAGLAGVLCCCLLRLCVCCWAWLSLVVSWWVLVAPGVVSRWRAVVCPWVLCCAVLLLRCAAWRCVVVRCVVSFCSVWCCRALCCVLGRCPSSLGPAPSGAVFCLVPPRCVCFAVVCRRVVLFAVVLCAVCALGCRVLRFLSSLPCAVLLCGALSLGTPLPCAVPRGAVLPRGAVVSCPAALLGLFLAWVWLYLPEKPLQNFVKYFFPLFFGIRK